MAPPAWLPPLNSHPNHTIQIEASENRLPPNLHYSPPTPVLTIRLIVTVDFHPQSTTSTSFPGLSLTKTLAIKQNPKTLAISIQQIVLTQHSIPFSLTPCHWLHNRSRTPPKRIQLTSDEEILTKIVSFVNQLSLKQDNVVKRKILSMGLEIRKSVTVPDQEFASWMEWYSEQKRVDAEFESDYVDAISRPRGVNQVFEEAALLLARKPASKLSIEELESVFYEGLEKEKACSVCLEVLVDGNRVTKLPCLHVFHQSCVLRWLRESRLCPLCRYQLPADD